MSTVVRIQIRQPTIAVRLQGQGPRGLAGEAAGLSDAAPQPLGVAAAGSGTTASRDDHVHLIPTLATLGAQAGTSGATLPTGGSIVTGQLFRLTAADATALAPPGLYVHDGTGWLCLAYTAAYALGNLGATPSHTLIAGARYTATVDQEVSGWTLTLSRPGLVSVTLANAGGAAVAQPAMSGRTAKLLDSTGWDAVTEALSVAVVEDDGTYLISSSEDLS